MNNCFLYILNTMTHKNIFEKLHNSALKAPPKPGVYLWRDESSFIIYVGKAKNLKNRLSSYFLKKRDIKTRILVSHAFSIEYIITANEYEALLLENTLIKQHNPRYNINLKDDKTYPVLRITNEDFPRIFKTRKITQDGSRYFGPYPNVAALETFIDSLNRCYPLRRCRRLQKRTSPCMYYHIGRCQAPCCNKVSKKTYNNFIEEISRLLEGEDTATQKKIEKDMKAAAKNL
ncbi:MAG: GIY-YIG nuclease family protein, partial [Treponemataceae bacterium]